jgi:hypothetical protein
MAMTFIAQGFNIFVVVSFYELLVQHSPSVLETLFEFFALFSHQIFRVGIIIVTVLDDELYVSFDLCYQFILIFHEFFLNGEQVHWIFDDVIIIWALKFYNIDRFFEIHGGLQFR